jgi:hypothetical protein
VAISLIGTPTSSAATGSTTQDWTLPAGWDAGDLALFYYYCGRGTGSFSPSGSLSEHLNAADSDPTHPKGRLYIGYRVLQQGDTTFSWTSGSVAGIDQVWGVEAWRGVDTAAPFDTSAAGTFQDTNDPTSPAVTPSVNDAAVLSIFGKANDYTGITEPTGYTPSIAISTNLGSDVSMGTAYKLLTGGLGVEEAPGVWALLGGAAGDDGTVYTLVLKPASGSETITLDKWLGHQIAQHRRRTAVVASGFMPPNRVS